MPRMVDLSYPIHDGMSTYPTTYHPKVEVTQLGTLESEGRESRRIVIGSHSGTHVDGASHFILGGRTVDLIPPDVLFGPARLVRLTHVGAGGSVDAPELAARLDGKRPERLILRYDWSSRWGTDEYYRSYPHLTHEAARLVVSMGVRLLGYDVPSCDDIRESGPRCDPDSPNHKLLLGSDVTLVEYLTGLDRIEADEFTIAAFPLRLRGGDGAPARVFAILP